MHWNAYTPSNLIDVKLNKQKGGFKNGILGHNDRLIFMQVLHPKFLLIVDLIHKDSHDSPSA